MIKNSLLILLLFEAIFTGCEKPNTDPSVNWEVLIPDTLTSTVISSICEYQDGSVWIGTNEGILVFTEDSILKLTKENGLLNNDILDIRKNNRNELLIFTASGINTYDGMIHILNNPGKNFDWYNFFAVDIYDNIWMLNNNLSRTSLQEISNDTVIFYAPLGNEPSDQVQYTCLFADSKGKIWFGSYYASIPLYSIENGIISHYFENNVIDYAIYAISEDKSNNMWFIGRGALIKYNGTHYSQFKDEDIFWLNNSCICFDHNDNPWIATQTKLMCLKNSRWSIEYVYTDSEYFVDPYTDQYIKYSKIMEDSRHNIWACTNKGIIRKSNN